jgi:hypothetical protein
VRSPTYHLEVNISDILEDGRSVVLEAENVTEEPSCYLLPTPTIGLPPSLQTVPRIPASDLVLADSRDDLDNLVSTSGTVRLVSTDELLHFKPREDGREGEFEREIEILGRLGELRGSGVDLRASELGGIVVSGAEGEMAIGFVVKLIPQHQQGLHPLEKGFCGLFELHKEWEEQVRETVAVLHAHGIVWGDVNPCNVVIDENLDAWVIDFGGNFNWEFVDEDKKETEEGDWQGIDRLFGEWLPSCRIWPSGDVGEVNVEDLV